MQEESEEPNIAYRTRSHLRIDGFEPDDNLDFPDVDINLYQNQDSEGDTEYKKFLNQCYSLDTVNPDANTEDNDPEYVYNDDIFSHGWRYDINEVILQQQQQLEESCDVGYANFNISQFDRVHLQPQYESPIKQHRRRCLDMFAEPEFARVLNHQLRQHIQLLAQTYLLTKYSTNMKDEAEDAKNYLDSYIKIFKKNSKPSNLLPTIELINNLPPPKDIRSSIRLNWRPLPIPEPIGNIIKDNPNIFIYPSLLPKVAFSVLPAKLMPKKPKINFTLNEDKLLAYALNEFKGESSPHAFIASLLMTAKTKTQISNHIKNIKRSQGCEDNPIKVYCSEGKLPVIELTGDYIESDRIEQQVVDIKEDERVLVVDVIDDKVLDIKHEKVLDIEGENFADTEDKKVVEKEEEEIETQLQVQDQDDLMNMDLDDLVAASTTISRTSIITSSNKSTKNLQLKKSMLNLMAQNFLLSSDMGDLIIDDFLKSSQQLLSERNHFHLLQLLADLQKKKARQDGDDSRTVTIYVEVSKFLEKISAPQELQQKLVLFLDLNQASQCGCSESFLHWMRFFKFMQHIELYHDGAEAFEKKLTRLIDALQKDDPHKIRLAIGNLVNKHPYLKREFESLSLDEKPHPSLFICDEDFDDVTEPMSERAGFELDESSPAYRHEHFSLKMSKEELDYTSQACPCGCHTELQQQHHCGKCNLKFMRGRMYLVNKIKPILAEWSYAGSSSSSSSSSSVETGIEAQEREKDEEKEWLFEEDREILEFCRDRTEDDMTSYDSSFFESLAEKSQFLSGRKKSAREIAFRFNQLMDMYKEEGSDVS